MAGLSGMVFGARRGLLLKTGQTTQYSSEADDGSTQKGLARAYTVLSSGQYSGTSNIDLAHYTSGAGAVTFDNTAKTIVDTGNGLAIVKTNDVITTSDENNPGPFTVTTGNVAGTITCTGATFVGGTPAGAVTIYKREAHSNNVVYDRRTKLYWSRYASDKLGSASNGLMPWTGQLYDIFQFAAVANAASLGGYTDWRVPNLFELMSLMQIEAPTSAPDSTDFPSFPTSDVMWTSTTKAETTANACHVGFDRSGSGNAVKTNPYYCILVRGGG